MKQVPPQKIVERVSERLKKDENIKPPQWSKFVKTGMSSERPPIKEDWWFSRSAAILRRIYVHGPVGTQRLRTSLGGRRRRGHKPAHRASAGGKIIRTILQQLEKAGYVKIVENPKKGRVITPKGQKLLEKAAGG
ncbi:MAG: 30S ribosomal protein S19e [Candidatus Aenigmatarchaeota archaeon]